jgi:YidC/Oxa1 family membrane protein insertase
VLRANDTEAVLRGRTDGGVEVVRTLTLVGDFELRIRDELRNTGTRQLNLREQLTASERELETKSSGWFQRPVGQLSGLCLVGDDMVRSTRGSLSGEGSGCGGCMSCGTEGPSGPQDRSGVIRFTAVDRHFFMTAVSPSASWGEASCQLRANGNGELQVSLEPVMFTEVPPGQRTAYVSTTYFGPKDYNLLRRQGPGRELWRAINYGWFAPLSHILLWALRLFHGWIGNWGLAVILLTLIIKGLLLPITHKSMMSMRKMQAEMAQFKPQLDEINERYKDNPDVKNQKVMEFYQQAGINPIKGMAGGCLPMFLQMPIWIALYRMISESVELYQAPFYFWLTDLSARDPYYILPALLGVAMLVQQLLTPQPAGMDNSQQKMMRWMMPIMFLFIMLNMPSGLTLYILANTLLTIAQQQFINRMVPAGVPIVAKGPSSPKPRDGDASTKSKPKRRKRK